MAETASFDLAAFQAAVGERFSELAPALGPHIDTTAWDLYNPGFSMALAVSNLSLATLRENKRLAIRAALEVAAERVHRSGQALEESLVLAFTIIRRTDVMRALCPALMICASNESFAIANTLTSILVPKILAGDCPIPLDDVVFSMLTLVLTRIGYARACEGYREIGQGSGERRPVKKKGKPGKAAGGKTAHPGKGKKKPRSSR